MLLLKWRFLTLILRKCPLKMYIVNKKQDTMGEYCRVKIDIDHLHYEFCELLCLNVQIRHNLVKYVLICIQNQNSFIIPQTGTDLCHSSQRTMMLQKTIIIVNINNIIKRK